MLTRYVFCWGLLLPLAFQRGGSSRCQSQAIPKATSVCWQENRKLTWEDFRATTKPATPAIDTAFGVAVGAITEANAVVYDRKTESGELLKTFVRVEFDTQKSWVNKRSAFNRVAALKHEQLHFDIVELTGRKIRRVLVRCATQHVDYHTPAITQEISALYAAEVGLDSRYDKEAARGDLKAQARWQAAIEKQLNALRQYKSTLADCEPPQ